MALSTSKTRRQGDAPSPCVPVGTKAGAVALVNDDEVKEVGRVLLIEPLALLAGVHGLVDAEVDVPRLEGVAALNDIASLAKGSKVL